MVIRLWKDALRTDELVVLHGRHDFHSDESWQAQQLRMSDLRMVYSVTAAPRQGQHHCCVRPRGMATSGGVPKPTASAFEMM